MIRNYSYYTFYSQYFHKNADAQFYDVESGIYYIALFYESLESDEMIENLVYDTGAFLAGLKFIKKISDTFRVWLAPVFIFIKFRSASILPIHIFKSIFLLKIFLKKYI